LTNVAPSISSTRGLTFAQPIWSQAEEERHE
jgi:hypothetical protein